MSDPFATLALMEEWVLVEWDGSLVYCRQPEGSSDPQWITHRNKFLKEITVSRRVLTNAQVDEFCSDWAWLKYGWPKDTSRCYPLLKEPVFAKSRTRMESDSLRSPCAFYFRGYCAFGNSCYYSHDVGSGNRWLLE